MRKPIPEHFGFTDGDIKRIKQIIFFVFLSDVVLSFSLSFFFFKELSFYLYILWIALTTLIGLGIHMTSEKSYEVYRTFRKYRKELNKYRKHLRKFGLEKEENEVKILNINTEYNNKLSPLRQSEVDNLIDLWKDEDDWVNFLTTGITDNIPLTYIDNLFYYTEKSNQYINGAAVLKGNEIFIRGLDQNVILHYGEYNKKYFIDMRVDNNTNVDYTKHCRLALIMNSEQLDFPNNLFKVDYFGMQFDNTYRFSNHFQKMNLWHEQKREYFETEVTKSIDKIKRDEELHSFLLRYISKFPNNLFLSPYQLTVFENSLLQNNFKGENTLLSRGTWEHYINKMIEANTQKYIEEGYREELWDYKINIPYDKEIVDNIKTYRSSYFSMIEEIMQKKRYFRDNTHCIFGTWKFLHNSIIGIYSKKWTDLYGKHFNDIENISLELCISRYLNIEEIKKEDEKLFSIFVYYLMYHKKLHHELNYNFIKSSKYLKEKMESLYNSNIEDTFKVDEDFLNDIVDLFINNDYNVELLGDKFFPYFHFTAMKDKENILIHANNYEKSFPIDILEEMKKRQMNDYKLLAVSNSQFTKESIRYCKQNSIHLWDKYIIEELEERGFSSVE